MEYVREFKPAPASSGIIASSVYTAGKRIADIPIEEAGEWAKKSGHVVWIGLLEPDRELWESCPHSLAKGEDFVLYAILDFIVDNYMPVLEQIEDEVEAIEDKILLKPMTGPDIERLYMLRRDLLRLRNAALPLVEVCRRLTSAELPQTHGAMHPLFRDATDHIRTVQEKVDSLREVLAFAFEAS